MKFIEKLTEAYKLGEERRVASELIDKNGFQWYLRNSIIREEKIESFGFLEKKAYDIAYHDSLLFLF